MVLDVKGPLQLDVSDNRYVPTPQIRKALVEYQEKHDLPPSGEFDAKTRVVFSGREPKDFLDVAYESSKSLGLDKSGKYPIFFDVGRVDLEGTWSDVLKMVVNKVDKSAASHVLVSGYADQSEALGGSAALSLISERRANAVRDALVAAGLDPKLIKVDWYGEKKPLVANPPDLSEPINRRAEIVVVSQ